MVIAFTIAFVLLFPLAFSLDENMDLVTLEWENTPQLIMNFSVGKTPSYFLRTTGPAFNISVEIAQMNVEDCGKEHPSISIVHFRKEYLDFCGTSINSPIGYPKFGAGSYGFTGEVQVNAVGRWAANDEAVVVATIYKVVDNCSECPAESNCGRGLAEIIKLHEPMGNETLTFPCPSSGCLCVPRSLKDLWMSKNADQLNALSRGNCMETGKMEALFSTTCLFIIGQSFSKNGT